MTSKRPRTKSSRLVRAWLSALTLSLSVVCWAGCWWLESPPRPATAQKSADSKTPSKPDEQAKPTPEEKKPSETPTAEKPGAEQPSAKSPEGSQAPAKPTQPAPAKPSAETPAKTEPKPEAKPAEPAPPAKALSEAEHKERLEQSRKLLDQGQFDQSLEAVEAILKAAPAAARREEAEKLKAAVLQRRSERDALQAAVKLLASSTRDEVRSAQERLFEKADAALPLLRQAVQAKEPLLVRNALESLRRLERPEAAMPIVVEVLQNPEQKDLWPDAIGQIALANGPGAGEPLLKLALSAESPEQRIAALSGLAKAFDPPAQTAVALLPMLYRDGAELPAALEAASHAIVAHRQFDIVSLRAWDVPLKPEEIRQFEGLPARIAQVMAADPSSPGAKAAKVLGIVTRQVPPEPLTGVKVLASNGEMEGSPASAVLDGVWNSTAPETMWRHPQGKRPSIIFDLGAERTVAGLRIWNLNEAGAGHRGWKDVTIYVGDVPSLLITPTATGQVPRAPGVKNPADYSMVVPVPFVRGRYIRLQMTAPWTLEAYAGLSEVQVLGF